MTDTAGGGGVKATATAGRGRFGEGFQGEEEEWLRPLLRRGYAGQGLFLALPLRRHRPISFLACLTDDGCAVGLGMTKGGPLLRGRRPASHCGAG